MLEYEPEKFPQSMRQGPKVAIPLRPPSSRHRNVESDLIFTIAVDTHQRQCEAKRAGQDKEQSLRGLRSLPERCLPLRGLLWPQLVAARLPSLMKTTRQEEKDLEVALGAVGCIHALRPPDNTRYGMHEGDRASGCLHPYGGVWQTTSYPE